MLHPPPISLTMLQFAIFLSLLYVITPTQSSTIYQVLRDHGLPMGLLPKGVQAFQIDQDGRFEVTLPSPCNARFENVVHYETNVSGSISYGQIGELSGIEAQELFLWFPVKVISVDVPSSGVIYFDVGVIKKQFSLSLFDTPPDCLAGEAQRGPGGARESEYPKNQYLVETNDAVKASI